MKNRTIAESRSIDLDETAEHGGKIVSAFGDALIEGAGRS